MHYKTHNPRLMCRLLTIQNREQRTNCNIENKRYTMLQSYRKYILYLYIYVYCHRKTAKKIATEYTRAVVFESQHSIILKKLSKMKTP